ncbi:MAG: potassium/proton antiporter [Porphyromonas sp.]|nr:potassium/proton antiporter [Porphyromonas sp.]
MTNMIMLSISPEEVLLYGSIMAIIGLYLSKAGFRLGLPTLLLFLGVGMAANATGCVEFNDPYVAQTIGVVALTVILFSGGMDTSIKEIKPVMAQGVLLATVGVLFTALITGTFIYYFFQWSRVPIQLTYLESLLLASVMSSTDSASVFSILRSKKLHLKHNIKPLLELESGSNDPMAYMLTVILIQLIQSKGSIGAWDAVGMFVMQFALGLLAGYLLGKLAVRVVNGIHLQSVALYPVMMLAFAFLIYSSTTLIHGNGFLAVYVAGLVVGNSKMEKAVSISRFFDGFQWLSQLVMFLTLGMMVHLPALAKYAVPALVVALFVMFIGRPVSVFGILTPFYKKLNCRARLYTSWVGLRGAVPIIFATYPLVAGLEAAKVIYAVVFFVTLVSLTIQGSTVSLVAQKLDLVDNSIRERVFSDVNLPDHIKSTLSEVVVTKSMLEYSNRLVDLNLPEESLAIMIERGNQYFIPRGNTELKLDDHVLIISNNDKALVEVYEALGVYEL